MKTHKETCEMARLLLALAFAFSVDSVVAVQRDVAPLPAEVIEALVNQPQNPKAIFADHLTLVLGQIHGALEVHLVSTQTKRDANQTQAYLVAAKSDMAAQRAALSPIKTQLDQVFNSKEAGQRAQNTLEAVDLWLAKAGSAQQIELFQAHIKQAISLLRQVEQSDLQQQALIAPSNPTVSVLKPYNLLPLTEAIAAPMYTRYENNRHLGVAVAAVGNLPLLPTPSEASACSYTAADLDKTQEEVNTVKYPELAALAKSLDYSPVKIFDYVYSNIAYKYNYFGSLKGAYGTYLTKSGNSFDQASLMVALLRASNVPARYVFGNIEITDAAPAGSDGRVNRWLGVKSYAAAKIVHQFASGGVPTLVKNASGEDVGFRTLHVWVQACVPYANYRGAALTNRGHRWIPLDASFKDMTYQPGIANSVGFDLRQFLQKRSNGPDSLPHEVFVKDVEQKVRSTNPGKGLSDVPYKGVINAIPFDILPATLPYRVDSFLDVGGGISDPAAMPEKFRQTLKIKVKNSSGSLLAERSVPLVEGLFKRITLSFKGSDATQQGRIDSWRSNTSMDSPEPSCSTTRVVPSIKLDGVEVAAGSTANRIDFCAKNVQLELKVSVPHLTCSGTPNAPDGCVNQTSFPAIEASNLYAILAYGDHASSEYLQKRINRLQASIRSSQAAPNANVDEIEGEFLNIVVQKFGNYVNAASDKVAQYTSRTIGLTGIHLGIATGKSKISYVFDQPFALNRKGFMIDVPGGQLNFINSTSAAFQTEQFFLASRSFSALESYIWQENAKTDAVSTIRGLQFANEAPRTGVDEWGFGGTPNVLALNSANWASDSSYLTYSAAEIATLKAEVDASATVYVPITNISYDGWVGSVYISENTAGQPSAKYAISGGYSGGYTLADPVSYNYNPVLDTGYSYIKPPSPPTFSSVVSSYKPPPAVLNSQINYGSTLGNTYSGDPVNMVTGNMYHNETDVDIGMRGGQRMVFQRAYNSRKAVDGPLGYGWTHSFNQYLTFRDDNINSISDAADTDGISASVTWTDGTGAEKFIGITSGASASGVASSAVFKAPHGHYFKLQKNSDSTYTLTDKGGVIYNFQAAAGALDQVVKLISITDRNGNTITLNYDTSQRLSSATDGVRSLTFAYEGSNTRIKSVTDWLARQHAYTYDAMGNLEKVFKPGVLTTATPSVTYTYHTSADGPNLDHAMKRFTHARGNFMEFTYYPNGRVLRHANALGETMSFSYNDFRRETVQINERGHERRFFFDKNGMPSKTIEENLSSRSFFYGGADTAERFTLTATVDTIGTRTIYSHDAVTGNLLTMAVPPPYPPTECTGPQAYDYVWPSYCSEYSGNGVRETRSHYNTFGQPGKIKDAKGLFALYKFDEKGNTLETIRLKAGFGEAIDPASYAPSPADAPSQIIAWSINTYDSYGNLLTAKQVRNMATKDGPTVEFGYDATNTYRNKITRRGDKNGDGVIAADEFDTATLLSDAAGQTKTGVNGRWEAVTYDYDEQGRVKTVKDAAGVSTRMSYDANGNVQLIQTEVTQANGVARQLQAAAYEYDLADRKVRSNALGLSVAYEYDAVGNLVKQYDPDGRWLTYTYDEMNRVVAAADKEGSKVVKTMDAYGRPLTVTDPNGLTTNYTYWDKRKDHRLKRVTQAKSASFAKGRAVEYDYDLLGNTTSIKEIPAGGGTARETLRTFDEMNRPTRVVGPVVNDPANGSIRRVTLYTYDTLGRLTEVRAGRTDSTGTNAGADVVSLQASYVYDDFGRKLKDIDGAGRAWTYTYNTAGDVLTVKDPRNKQTTYQWEVGGFLMQRQNEVGTVTYTRDALGLPTRIVNTNPAYTQDFTYNPQRRLESVRDSRGAKTLYYEYSKAGQLNVMRDSEGSETNYLYDGTGRLMGLWASNYDYTAFGYDKGGRLVERWAPNGLKSSWGYNGDGSLATVEHSVNTWPRASHNYEYDAWGNRITHNQKIGSYEVGHHFEFDELDRLVSTHETETETLTNYRYDILDNRTRVTDAAGNYAQYVYDTVGGVPTAVGAQQLNQIDLYSEQGVKQSTLGTFGYDAAGNLSSKAVNGVVQSLTWDANNDLRQVDTRQTANGATTIYSEGFDYDHEGRRINRLMLTGNTLYASMYLYNGEDIHKEYGTQWTNPVAIYTHGPGRDDPLIYQSAAGNRYYHADGLGTPSVVTDALGNVHAYRVHDAWGALISGEGSIPAYGFTGREPDLSTGYMYYRNRYYDSALGRFISRDPIGQQGGLNPYAYVDNNPVNNTDPDGLFARSVTNTVSGVGSVIGGYYDTTTSTLSSARTTLQGWSMGGGGENSLSVLTTPTATWQSSAFQSGYQARQTFQSYVGGPAVALEVLTGGGIAGGPLKSAAPLLIGAARVESAFFRGAKAGEAPSFVPRPNDFRVDPRTGFVKDTHGISVFDNPGSVSSKGFVPHRVDQSSMPDTLRIFQRGSDPRHFEITPMPGANLTPTQFINACSSIVCIR
jgi:RHS repeat-associated protein